MCVCVCVYLLCSCVYVCEYVSCFSLFVEIKFGSVQDPQRFIILLVEQVMLWSDGDQRAAMNNAYQI